METALQKIDEKFEQKNEVILDLQKKNEELAKYNSGLADNNISLSNRVRELCSEKGTLVT